MKIFLVDIEPENVTITDMLTVVSRRSVENTYM